MSKTNSPDLFARGIGVFAICLTIVSLYFTNRTYNWQKRVYEEAVQDKVSTRFGFKIMDGKGAVTLEVANTGSLPIHIKSVEMEAPNGCKVINMQHTSAISDDDCWIPIYGDTGEALIHDKPTDLPRCWHRARLPDTTKTGTMRNLRFRNGFKMTGRATTSGSPS